ncbi:probable chitinase 10 [Ceratina calcarata]|uniref:Probable chitinase 10 n=1 Tax=Ceratina calcarata TaxID=156304 RepID=A0AAJ7JHW9_9HYME|nr:probable chitinase 10 [Ceratina calcarata]
MGSTTRTACWLLLICLIVILGTVDNAEGTKRRFRRPATTTQPITTDQEVSASVNRFKVTRNRVSNTNKNKKNEIQNGKPEDYKLVCYYTNWSQYRTKIGKFLPEDIQPDLCTHIIFAFGWLKKNKLTSFESNDETKDGKIGLYERMIALKKANPSLKVLLAIGGWSFGTQKFKDMASTRYARQTFIYSAISYLRDRDFDGLDIDWEYPKGGDDKKNYVLLLKELREAFEAEAKEKKMPRLLLTAAVPVGPDNVKGGYDVPAVASYLDFINLMAYDFHGKWERETGHNAPLYASSLDSEWQKQLSVDNAATMWVRLGAPKEKLIIGMPTYGRSFTLSNPSNFRVHSAASGGGKAGEYTKESGFLAYYEICEMLQNGAIYIWDDEMKVPYLVHNDQWVGFDDEKSIRGKMDWLKNKGYGGAMVWTVDMDDFNGTVCAGNVRYPLIGAMREELLGISRGPNAKDVDWTAVASTVTEAMLKKPEAYKVPVTEVIGKVKKLQKSTTPIINLPTTERSAQSMCYLTNWSHRRAGAGKFVPEDIDPTLCTHVVYAFATLKNHLLTAENEKDKEMYERLIALRDKNPDIKILLAIGGWAFGSTPFKELTSNTFRMNQFVYEAIEFLREYKFDGLDVDWEYPRGSDDRAAYVNLLKELRLAFEGEANTSGLPKLILSAAVPASFEAIAAGYDVPEISKYLDFINIMTYDLHGQWERQVGHNSPLFPLESATSYQKKLTVDYSAREWVKQGAPKEKLMIGMPTYGRSFTLVDKEKFDIGAPASGGGTPGNYTNESGFLSYYEICGFLNEDNTTLVWDSEQQVPFAYKEDQWVGFDDERSLINKMQWLKEEGFGGVMIWSVDMDDFNGLCGAGKYPLIKAMMKELRDYKVKLEYDGPYENHLRNGKYATKDPNEVSCEEEDNHISYHPDKSDCTMYYMCEGERKHHMPCPVNLVFNPNENVCDWPENVEGCLQHTQTPPV